MKSKRIFFFTMVLIVVVSLSACSNIAIQQESKQPSGEIYLYGEKHGVDKILDKEFELWYEYYHNQGMRHLFVELPYYTAEFLNIWMQSSSDDILDAVYKDWSGSLSHNPSVKEFYKRIKTHCPETIFHGTDVGHQYNTTGERFLSYLRSNNLKDSEQYLLTNEAIDQGRYFYRHSDHGYRENAMAENFIREFDKIRDENIMGIYGAAHTGLDSMDYTNSVPSMANQLKEYYGNIISSEDLSSMAKDTPPLRVDTLNVSGRDYEAMYFGKQNLPGFKEFAYREFWRLENAYDNFGDRPKTGEVLPYNEYPMFIETGQVFVIDYTKTDGSVIRKYYRCDGYVWNDLPSTEEFKVE